MTKTIAVAKQLFYWPCMKIDIESFIETRNIFIKLSCSKIKEQMEDHKIPEIPLSKIEN